MADGRRSSQTEPEIGSREWPLVGLHADDLVKSGWRPVPLREFVLKVHQRCNLACDYCYIYTMGDDSWRHRPRTMGDDVVRMTAERIAEHAQTHRLPSVRVIFHGGEPLLAGAERLAAMATRLREAVAPGCTVHVVVQSNGTLLTTAALDVLWDARIGVGVSIDGAGHDRHRRRRSGQSSRHEVRAALDRLAGERYRLMLAGLLCTVHLDSDPVATFDDLVAYRPPAIEFLLPHANWHRPPQRPADDGRTAYGDWLVRAFDRWYHADPVETRVQLFDDIIAHYLGGTTRSEQIGLTPLAAVVVESDGTIEHVDSLRSAFPGATATGLSVRNDAFDAILTHPGMVARQIGIRALCDSCLRCPYRRACGGGHYAHRYRPGTGFRNPSVYCDDLVRLVGHVRDRMIHDLIPLAGGAR